MTFHAFFTAKHTKNCFRYGRFGASAVNALANVKTGDIAFLFDSSRWEIYGPIKVISDVQFYEDNEIYGRNKKGGIKYKNRVALEFNETKCIEVNKLFASETSATSRSYHLNRTILSTLICNKQVSCTPLTNIEGNYLVDTIIAHGSKLTHRTALSSTLGKSTVKNHVVVDPSKKSEALLEMLLLEDKRCRLIYTPDENCLVYNQFVLGYQRQVDIISINSKSITVVEIKAKNNKTDPFRQISEYIDYVRSDIRLEPFRGTNVEIKPIILLEEGNRFLVDSEHKHINNLSVYKIKNIRNREVKISWVS